MMMSDSEICASYRDAKNKNSQIEVLAELNATTTEQIKEILKKRGVLFGKRGPKPKATIAEADSEPITAENLAKAADITLDKKISEKMDAIKAAEKAGVPVTEELKETFEKIEKEETKLVPHIRVPIPPVVREAIEKKLSDLETEIKHHEEQLALLNRQYKEVVDYLTAEGRL